MSIEARCEVCRKWVAWADRQVTCSCGQTISHRGQHEFSLRVRVEVAGRAGRVRKRVTLGWITIVEALRCQREFETLRKGGESNPFSGSGIHTTWRQAMLAYLNKLEAEQANTQYWNDTRRYLNRMLQAWGDIALDRITPDMIEAFRLGLLRENLSKSSCDRHHAAGKACWKYSGRGLGVNPFTELRLYLPKNDQIHYLIDSQVQALLDAARKVSRPLFEIIAVALSTGLRRGNVQRLKRSEVDFEQGAIRIIQKGGTPHMVPLSPTLRELLLAIPDNGTEYFWISPRTGRPWRTDWRRAWERAKGLAGIPKDFRFHDLRHTVATMILRETGNLRTVQEVLGHSDFKVTVKYAHILPEHLIETITQITPPLDG